MFLKNIILFKNYRLLAIIVSVLFFIFLLILAYFHNVFEEWDGIMQLWAGREILKGVGYLGWTSHFWPPLYSLLVGLLDLVIDGFWAAKLVSIISSSFLLYIIFLLSKEISNNHRVAFWTQIFFFVNPIYVLSSIEAENHLLDALFFVLALYFFIKFFKNEKNRNFYFVFSAISLSLSCLTRYTSYSALIVYLFFIILKIKTKKRFVYAGLFIIIFLIVSSPWLIYNWKINGSPLHNWQYLNVGFAVIGNKSSQWWWQLQDNYHSLSDVFLHSPSRYLKNFFLNFLFKGPGSLVVFNQLFGSFSILALIFIFVKKREQNYINWLSLGLILFYLLLASNAFVAPLFLLPVAIVSSVITVIFFFELSNKYQLIKFLLLPFLIFSLTSLSCQFKTYIQNNDWTDGQNFPRLKEAVNEIKKRDPEIQQKIIMAQHPIYAYYLNSQYISMPLYYNNNPKEIVKYGGLSQKIKNYSPKFPSTLKNERLKADYFICDLPCKNQLGYDFLFDKNSEKIPENFELIYFSPEIIVYKILTPS